MREYGFMVRSYYGSAKQITVSIDRSASDQVQATSRSDAAVGEGAVLFSLAQVDSAEDISRSETTSTCRVFAGPELIDEFHRARGSWSDPHYFLLTPAAAPLVPPPRRPPLGKPPPR